MKIEPGRMVGWNFPNSEICVRVARYEFGKNHPTFPTKYSNSLYVSQLYGRFSVVFSLKKIYLSYFFFQNRHFLAKKIFFGQTDPSIKGPPDPSRGAFRALSGLFATFNGRFPLCSFLKFFNNSARFLHTSAPFPNCPD